MSLRILVTGCGGDIGQSIGKILNESDFVTYVIGCDISDKNAGKFIFDNFYLGLPCSHEKYIASLEKVVKEKRIDLVIPVSEPELRFLSRSNVLDNIGGAKIIAANAECLKVGFDKLKTANFLEQHQLPFPKTKLLSEVREIDEYPVIVKSRTGSGSSSVYMVKDNIDLEYLRQKHPDFIVQEFLSLEKGEFTCGVFRAKNGEIRSIILKRELTGGYSGYGEVVKDKDIERVLNAIAENLKLEGSINVQLRITSKGPVVFEINPRFSSTVLFRHKFGFEDLIWSIQDNTTMNIDTYTVVESGRKFYKGFSEYID